MTAKHNYLVINHPDYLYLKEPVEHIWCSDLDEAFELAQDLAAGTGTPHMVLARVTLMRPPTRAVSPALNSYAMVSGH